MCGIVGYLGPLNPKDVIMQGLKKLEYRGYDSAGLAVIQEGHTKLIRAMGKLQALDDKIKNESWTGHIGIGHTRWATHGVPSERNAHPHKVRGITLVHNGIIENYHEIKDALLAKGAQIASDTDSELVEHLIAAEYEKVKDLKSAVERVLPQLLGAFSIVVLCEQSPNELIAFKDGPPLVVGLGKGENFVASDVQGSRSGRGSRRAPASRWSRPVALPLDGIRVLDLSSYIAGPYGCSLLPDLGADVVKIESPEGDTLRKYPSTLAAESRAFLGVNRGKRGLALDLKKPEGLAVLKRLVAKADVLVHNFRPSVPPRLGIDWESLRAVNPRLVYCALTGYGETGPLKDKAGYDQVLQALTGMCAMQGPDADHPQILYGSVVDYYAASMLALAVSSALFQRSRTGEGCEVDVSLLRSALALARPRGLGSLSSRTRLIQPSRVTTMFASSSTMNAFASNSTSSRAPPVLVLRAVPSSAATCLRSSFTTPHSLISLLRIAWMRRASDSFSASSSRMTLISSLASL